MNQAHIIYQLGRYHEALLALNAGISLCQNHNINPHVTIFTTCQIDTTLRTILQDIEHALNREGGFGASNWVIL